MQAMNLKIPTDKTLAIIMGGGAGTRLFPLTKERAKPAVPLGGDTGKAAVGDSGRKP